MADAAEDPVSEPEGARLAEGATEAVADATDPDGPDPDGAKVADGAGVGTDDGSVQPTRTKPARKTAMSANEEKFTPMHPLSYSRFRAAGGFT